MIDDFWQTHEADAAGRDRWLLSYADLLTLLLAFFVVMYSVSAVNEVKLSELAESLSASFESREIDASKQPNPSELVKNLQDVLAGQAVTQASNDHQTLTVTLPGELLFASGETALTIGGQQALVKLAAMLKRADGIIRVEGHTDNQPIASRQFPSNWELSAHRAAAAVRFLEAQGIPKTKLSAVGLSDTQPIGDNRDAQGRQTNRRLVIQLTQINWAGFAENFAVAQPAIASPKSAVETPNPQEAEALPEIEDIDPALLEQVLQNIETEGN